MWSSPAPQPRPRTPHPLPPSNQPPVQQGQTHPSYPQQAQYPQSPYPHVPYARVPYPNVPYSNAGYPMHSPYSPRGYQRPPMPQQQPPPPPSGLPPPSPHHHQQQMMHPNSMGGGNVLLGQHKMLGPHVGPPALEPQTSVANGNANMPPYVASPISSAKDGDSSTIPPASPASTSFQDDDNSMISSPSTPAIPPSYTPTHHNGPITVMQRLMELGNEPDRRAWVEKYLQFMEERGKPLNNLPQVAKQPLDLFRLYVGVKDRGGVLEVVKTKKWKEVSQFTHINASASAAYTLRRNYTKFLIDFEYQFDRDGMDPRPAVQEIEAMTKKKPSAKAKEAAANQLAKGDDGGLTDRSTPQPLLNGAAVPPQMQPGMEFYQHQHSIHPSHHPGQPVHMQNGPSIPQYQQQGPPMPAPPQFHPGHPGYHPGGHYGQSNGQGPPYAMQQQQQPPVPNNNNNCNNYNNYSNNNYNIMNNTCNSNNQINGNVNNNWQQSPIPPPPPPPAPAPAAVSSTVSTSTASVSVGVVSEGSQTDAPVSAASTSAPASVSGSSCNSSHQLTKLEHMVTSHQAAQQQQQQQQLAVRQTQLMPPLQQHQTKSQLQQQQQMRQPHSVSSMPPPAMQYPPNVAHPHHPHLHYPSHAQHLHHQHYQMQQSMAHYNQLMHRPMIALDPKTVEGIEPKIKHRPLTQKEVGPVDLWRVLMALRSGLLVEVSWALNVLNVLLADQGSRDYFTLSRLTGLFDALVDIWRRLLIDLHALRTDENMNLLDLEISNDNCGQNPIDKSIAVYHSSKHVRNCVREPLTMNGTTAVAVKKRKITDSQSNTDNGNDIDDPIPLSPVFVNESEEDRNQLRLRCRSTLNILRSLSFLPNNESVIGNHAGFLRIAAALLNTEGDTMIYDIDDLLVIVSNIAGHIELQRLPECICRPLVTVLLRRLKEDNWFGLACESLAKICVRPENIDLLLATPDAAQLSEILQLLCSKLRQRDQIQRELALALLVYLLVHSDNWAVCELAAACNPNPVRPVLDFLEQVESQAVHICQQYGVQTLHENPDLLRQSAGIVSLDQLQRAVLALRCLAERGGQAAMDSLAKEEDRMLMLCMSSVLQSGLTEPLAECLRRIAASNTSVASSSSKSLTSSTSAISCANESNAVNAATNVKVKCQSA